MINWEESKMIQILYKQGYSKKHIARKLSISINTVRKYIKSGKEPAYQPRPKKPLKLDPYKPYIIQRLDEAKPHWIPSTVIYREIKSQGYPGGRTQLRDFMKTLKPQPEQTPIRFETEAGKQMQVDWAVFRRGKDRLSAFIATLGYSRACYVEFVTDETLETLIRCHQNAFEYFGGIPKTILYDNMKTVIIQRNAYGAGDHRFQAGFWDYAKNTGFIPKVCKPYRAQTKGKVERFIHYLRYSFYYPLVGQLKGLGLFLDKDTANMHVLKWLNEVANQRLHATTNEIVFERMQEEQKYLQPLVNSYVRLTETQETAETHKLKSLDMFDTENFQHDLSIYQQITDVIGVAI